MSNSNIRTITAIHSHPSRSDYVIIYFDDKYKLQVGREIAVKTKLKVGQEITEETLQVLQTEEEFAAAKDLALRYLTHRSRSVYQIYMYLLKKEFTKPVIQQVLQFLSHYGYVDDRRFAEDFLENRLKYRPRSVQMLRFELKQKGIGDDVIDDALETIHADDRETALILACKRLAKMKGMDEKVRDRRMISFLARRGYGMGTIQEVLRLAKNTSNLDND